MSPEPVHLPGLLVDISALNDFEAEAEGERCYQREFITRNGKSGTVTAHDGAEVKFFANRYHHAVHTSHDRARQAYAKNKVARDRIERLRWIKPLLEGRVADFECWEVPLKVPEEGIRWFPGKRLYVSWGHCFIVWLEPLRAGGFKFSSAYPVPQTEIGRYTSRARKLWPKANQ